MKRRVLNARYLDCRRNNTHPLTKKSPSIVLDRDMEVRKDTDRDVYGNELIGSSESDSCSESDNDSLTEDLDQVGRLNLSLPIKFNFKSYINRESFNFANLPLFEVSKIQELSKELSNYLANYRNQNDTEATHHGNEIKQHQERLINTIKTAISTRIQMNNILNDLDLGFSITTAIDRLQPLKDIVHDAISLPAEDTSDFDDDYDLITEEHTEPVGVDEIVNEDGLFINDIVRPEDRRAHRRFLFSEGNDSSSFASDLDNVEGLSIEEVKDLTDLDSLEDFRKESLLREKIQKIQGFSNLSQHLKSKLVTRLMMGNYKKYIRLEPLSPSTFNIRLELSGAESDGNESDNDALDDLKSEISGRSDEYSLEDEVILTDKDQEATYFDSPFNQIMGCQHYQRNCKVECPICLRWFTCRFCHDNEISDHKLTRSQVKHVLCMNCLTPQVPKNNYCVECGLELAHYFCRTCVLYDNDPTKDIYHCDQCGICRLGLGIGKDYFHCDKCNICLSIDLKEKHKCLSNTTHCNCPVCNEYLFTSVNKVVFMKCGHSIHQHCYDELSKHFYKCPICKKTVVNVEAQFRILDQEIIQLPLPAPYNHWKCVISCNDCKGKSYSQYHVLGLKCKYCKSYNTNQLKLIKPEEEDESERGEPYPANEREAGSQLLLAETNLGSNFRIDEQNNSHNSERQNHELGEVCDDNINNIVDIKNLTTSLVNNIMPQSTTDSTVSYLTAKLQSFLSNQDNRSDNGASDNTLISLEERQSQGSTGE
ncbi:uncharacterized protein PRCAT00003667001 [Priceomyces carsonii]|uniref:uncharacterized protein n=1 Tax=Priceomyces carsonii TaxID=28549 RepID=UPI002EDAFF74|nr:unnamed protein product [Priceomyces carsonii]